MPERSLPPLPDGTIPYVPVPVPPDPARDARVAARRAADARRAGEALDRIMGAAGRLDPVYAAGYRNGFRDGYTESELHHNRNYGVSDDDSDPDRDTGAGLRLMRERGLLP